MQTIVYKFGLKRPIDFTAGCEAELERMTALWNRLVEIDRERERKFREVCCQQSPEYANGIADEPITSEALTTAKGRVSKLAKERAERLNLPYKHFTLHDLKRTGITDTKGDKFDAGGHRTRAMLNIYDMSVPEVKTTRESNEQ